MPLESEARKGALPAPQNGDSMAEAERVEGIATMSFEEALAELEGIVTKLEQGRITLDEAIGAYERGAALKKHCEGKLREATEKVEKISLGPGGSVSAAPMDQA